MAEDTNALDRLSEAGNEAIDLINRVDTATGKFQPGKRQGSIIKAAQKNIFEFPVFISNSVPLDFATATVSLLEQNYAAYLQMAISINPVVDAKTVKNGLQFAQYKVNTNKYLEYTEPGFQHDVCHNVIQEGKYVFEFDLLSIEDSEARLINEAVDYQPLSEFSHFFQEDIGDLRKAADSMSNEIANRNPRREVMVPLVNVSKIQNDPDGFIDALNKIDTPDDVESFLKTYGVNDNIGNQRYVTMRDLESRLQNSIPDRADEILNDFENQAMTNNSMSFIASYDSNSDLNNTSKAIANTASALNTLANIDKNKTEQIVNKYMSHGSISDDEKNFIADKFKIDTSDKDSDEQINTCLANLYNIENTGAIANAAKSNVSYDNLAPGLKRLIDSDSYENLLANEINKRVEQSTKTTNTAQQSLMNAIQLNMPFDKLDEYTKALLGNDGKKYGEMIANYNARMNTPVERAKYENAFNKLTRLGANPTPDDLAILGIDERTALDIRNQINKQRTYDANRDQYTQAQTASTKFNYAMNKLNNGIELSPSEQNDLGIKNPEDYERLKTQAQALRDKDLAQSQILQRQAQKANSKFYRGAEALQTGLNIANTAANTVNAATNAAYNISTFRDRKAAQKLANQNMELQQEKLKQDLADHDELMRMKKNEMYGKMKTSNIQYVDDSKCNKMNTMKPLLMKVTLSMLNKDDSIQPIEYVIGVKTHNRVIPASILPEVAKYPLKEMDKISRKIKWRAGELKFLKDLVFRINEKKQTAADARDPNRKWYRRLYELAHMKGDAPATAVVQGKSIFAAFIRDKQGKSKLMHGFIPNAAIVMSQADVNNIKQQTEIDLLKGSSAKKFCGELFLMNLVVIDTDAGSIKIMQPDEANDYSVHSLASVNKQLATLDTAGTKTRDMFKLLG
jgi:hypothetical protein